MATQCHGSIFIGRASARSPAQMIVSRHDHRRENRRRPGHGDKKQDVPSDNRRGPVRALSETRKRRDPRFRTRSQTKAATPTDLGDNQRHRGQHDHGGGFAPDFHAEEPRFFWRNASQLIHRNQRKKFARGSIRTKRLTERIVNGPQINHHRRFDIAERDTEQNQSCRDTPPPVPQSSQTRLWLMRRGLLCHSKTDDAPAVAMGIGPGNAGPHS